MPSVGYSRKIIYSPHVYLDIYIPDAVRANSSNVLHYSLLSSFGMKYSSSIST